LLVLEEKRREIKRAVGKKGFYSRAPKLIYLARDATGASRRSIRASP